MTYSTSLIAETNNIAKQLYSKKINLKSFMSDGDKCCAEKYSRKGILGRLFAILNRVSREGLVRR